MLNQETATTLEPGDPVPSRLSPQDPELRKRGEECRGR